MKRTPLVLLIVGVASVALMAMFAMSQRAEATSGRFDTFCEGCHPAADVGRTCHGCHAHGAQSSSAKDNMNVTATTDKTVYTPGEAMTVTVDGGYEPGGFVTGWIRVILYDQNMTEITRSTGPSGTGGGSDYPVVLSATAPASPGTYTFTASWYGNQYDLAEEGGTTTFGPNWTPDPGNPDHGEERVSTNSFTVSSAPVPDISVSTTTVAFGEVTEGSYSDQEVTVTNAGNAELTIGAIAQSDPLALPFSIVTDNCSGQAVAASGSCTFTVRFAPVAVEAFSDTFDIPSDDPDENTVTVSVSGEGRSSDNPPTVPELVYPSDGAHGLGTVVEVRWRPSTDPDGDPVSYQLFVSTDPEFADTVPIDVVSLDARSALFAGAGAGMVWVGALFIGGLSTRRKVLLVVLVLMAVGALLASCGGDAEWDWDVEGGGPAASADITYTLTGLSPATTYYWKVVADDGRGATAESEVRQFTTE